ncbi:hypothetical protein VCHC44C1_2347A, partial [Vibrio cholerae HC-44C1]|jgi:hypothetical protein|eukprot:SM001867S03791  [mRNA]  locus=s1867:618:629:+ [translate_table: standard]
MWR